MGYFVNLYNLSKQLSDIYKKMEESDINGEIVYAKYKSSVLGFFEKQFEELKTYLPSFQKIVEDDDLKYKSLELYTKAVHDDKGKPAGSSSCAIKGNDGFKHDAGLAEVVDDIVFGNNKGKVSYVKFGGHEAVSIRAMG